MSWQAVRAVIDNCKELPDKGWRVMVVIAERANEKGVASPGPSQALIAREVNCTERTVRNWITRLEEDGLLESTRGGNGAGHKTSYRIKLEMPEHGVADTEYRGQVQQKALENKVDMLAEQVATLAKVVTALVEQEANKGENKAEKGGKTGTERGKTDGDKGEQPISAEPLEPKEPLEPVAHLAKKFEQRTGFPIPHEATVDWRIDWEQPLEAIYKRAGNDLMAADGMMADAIRIMRGDNPNGKTYFIRNPGSILTTVLNLTHKDSAATWGTSSNGSQEFWR